MPKLYEMRIELLEMEVPVWRSLLVPDDMSLINVGAVLLGAMGWQAAHLFGFEIDGKRYDMRFGDGLDLDGSIDMDGVIASDVFRPKVEAAFHYDFGDDWWHRLEILDHRPVAAGDKPPRCIGGEGACPPEDSGGPYGYADMLEAFNDPEHPDHADVREWIGEMPSSLFDTKKANQNIRRCLRAYAT